MVEAAEAVVCGAAAKAEASCGGIGVCCSTMATAATAPTAVMPPPRAPPVVTLPASEATAAATSMASFCRGDDDALLLHDCDEHLLLSSMLYSSLTAKGAAGALLDEAGVASVRSFQTEAGKGASGAASASLNKVLVEVVGVVLVTKNGLHASDVLIVVVVIKKGFAVVTVCEASVEAVEAVEVAAGAVARLPEDTLLDLVVDATNACQTGPRTFGTTAAAAAATAIVVSLVSKVSFLLGEASVILRSSRNSRLFFVVACCKRR